MLTSKSLRETCPATERWLWFRRPPHLREARATTWRPSQIYQLIHLQLKESTTLSFTHMKLTTSRMLQISTRFSLSTSPEEDQRKPVKGPFQMAVSLRPVCRIESIPISSTKDYNPILYNSKLVTKATLTESPERVQITLETQKCLVIKTRPLQNMYRVLISKKCAYCETKQDEWKITATILSQLSLKS